MTHEEEDGFMESEQSLAAQMWVEDRTKDRLSRMAAELRATNANLEKLISVVAALQDSVKLLARHTENLEEARSAD